MDKQKPKELLKITAERLTGDGATIGTFDAHAGDLFGKKCFIWGALPGEVVNVEIIKQRSKFCVAIVKEVIEKSKYRENAVDSNFINTSPWQVYDYEYELKCKHDIIVDAFNYHKVDINRHADNEEVITDGVSLEYRNKYIFYFTKNCDLGTPMRESGEIEKSETFSLPSKNIVKIAFEIQKIIKNTKLSTSDNNIFHSLLIREDGNGIILSKLNITFSKDAKDSKKLIEQIKQIFDGFQNLLICEIYAPKQGVIREVKQIFKSDQFPQCLSSVICANELNYGINSFFQINENMFERFLTDLCEDMNGLFKKVDSKLNLVDMYCGIGSIGLTIMNNDEIRSNFETLKLVEIDNNNAKFLEKNARNFVNSSSSQNFCEVIISPAAKSISPIEKESCLIVDPPRNGLDSKVKERICEVLPKVVIYLSCNPMTQARDIAQLIECGYEIKTMRGYNFFPRTPHIENLVILESKK